MVLETILYAGAMGVSQVSLMVSVAFWTWLWGPLGLLMATPLTVCLVVLGQARARPALPRHAPVGRAGADAGEQLLPAAPGARPGRSRRHRRALREGRFHQRRVRRDADSGAELRRARSHRGPAVAATRRPRSSTRRAMCSTCWPPIPDRRPRLRRGVVRILGYRRQRHRRRARAADAGAVHRRSSRRRSKSRPPGSSCPS